MDKNEYVHVLSLPRCIHTSIPDYYKIIMASGERSNSVTSVEEGAIDPSQDNLSEDVFTTCTIEEKEFGSGTSDCDYQARVWKDMGKLFQQETLSDVMLMAEGQSIPCHKFLLAAASEYLYNRLVVASDAVDHNLLEIEGISFQTLKVIVSYIYTGNINITVQNAGDVISFCKTLKLNSAYDTCEAFLKEQANPANCIGLHRMAIRNDVKELKEKTREIMMNNFNEVVAAPEFLDMSVDEVDEYIQNEDLRITNEDPVYDAVISWIRHQPEERESSFSHLLKSVRLRFCSAYCLKYTVAEESLMGTGEHQKALVSALKHQDPDTLCWDRVRSDCKDCSILPRVGYHGISNMIIIGGVSETCVITMDQCWRLENGEWKGMKGCSMPETVRLFSACMARDGIVVTGGYSSGKPVSQCWLLSTTHYQWTRLPDLGTARLRHASVCVGGQVYVLGGEGTGEINLSSVEMLQRNGRQWDILPDLPKVVVHPMAAAYGQCVYVFGGTDGAGQHSVTVHVYGTNRKSWKKLTNMPGICEFGAPVVWKDMIYIVGGFTKSCMSFDPALNRWSTLSQSIHGHSDAPAVVWKDRILICGGRSIEAKRDDGTAGGTSVIEEYDPDRDNWTVSQIQLPHKLCAHVMFTTE